MSGSRMSVRDSSAVGRFHSAAASNGQTIPEKEVVTTETKEEGGCRRWLRKASPCCIRSQSHSYNVTNDQDTPVLDDLKVTPIPESPQPYKENNEMEDLSLVVRSVDLLSSKTDQNRREHHTEKYHSDELIIRRGQTFQIMLDLSRPFNINTDKLHLELKTGLRPLVSKGTHIIIPVMEELQDLCWEAKVVEQNANRIKLSINSPPDAVIGKYKLTVSTRSTGSESVTTHDPEKDIYMLFNPWCKVDTVYMEDDAEKNEYVLNDTGKIYYGTEKQIGARTWNYGQFQEGILEACLYLLEKREVRPSGCGDSVNVVRVISAMINAQDDFGVLEGNWSGNYQGGTSPTAWSGSVDILKKYHKSEGVPVKYGQCWVFSGVTTTVLRCLGIPARSVTNFQSAHDTDVSLTTDVYFDENMEPINKLNSDSVWNFHVWNDCWMARPDLPPGMGGWQAVDSTPQETSQGMFRCGPASLMAIRTGQVYLKHDAPFVFAEVNSDKIYWQKNLDGNFSKIRIEKNAVGHCISTKAVGSDQRSDITHLYKHPEGSEEERIAVETACRYGTKPDVYQSGATDDVCMEVCVEGEGPRMGTDAHLKIVLKNQSQQPRQTTLHSQVAVMYYTGVLKDTVKTEKLPVYLQPNEEKVVDWVLPYDQYQDQLVDQAALMLTLSGRVNETMQVLASQTSFRLRTPDIHVEPIGEAFVGKQATAKLTFTNPLPCTLRNVVLRVEGLGLRNLHPIKVGDVSKHATVKVTEHFIPSVAGTRKLVASLDCKQLSQVHGVADITVQE
ncbi:protein-glutamine gamma-glutamyltransferase K [Tachysurus fulvidraco]|uniref:protein-glutamine gamma-glutamyltransferase K n=1 Tax=Tachysurus fulvidraco TaxID=1234273 RepID=UPI000F4DB9B0|nr:protein-glutamine gamma-glutamyltransferase K [Tachysurus fulvidraco]XP_027006520.1 protein-glutamine gamma-glutamyltransferase K [Tachysurus fulvidraco]